MVPMKRGDKVSGELHVQLSLKGKGSNVQAAPEGTKSSSKSGSEVLEAVRKGDLAAVRKTLRGTLNMLNLLDTNVNTPNRKGATPLHLAARLHSEAQDAILKHILANNK